MMMMLCLLGGCLLVCCLQGFGRLDVLVNNAAQQEPHEDLTELDPGMSCELMRRYSANA